MFDKQEGKMMTKENAILSDDEMDQVAGGTGKLDTYTCGAVPDDQSFQYYYSLGIPNDCPYYRPKRTHAYCSACLYCGNFKGE
jgi:hypothetical protein